MFGFPQPQYLPCPECGESVACDDGVEHVCDAERRLDYVLLHLREEIAELEEQVGAWLDSAEGRFAAWLAERDRR